MKDLAPSADVVDPPRGPGRPPVGKKVGGRKPGSKNKRTKEVEVILRPLIPGAKKRIRALLESENDETAFKALQMVFSYVYGKPVDRREVSGPDGQPFEEPLSDFDLARRIMLVLGRAGLVTEPDHTAAAKEFAEAGQRSQESTDAPDGPEGSETAENGEAAPVPSEGVDGASEPEPPPEGKSISFGSVEIRNIGPQRPGLPPTFAVCRDGLAVQHGSWPVCLSSAEKLVGPPQPSGKVIDAQTDSRVSWNSRSDERPSPPPQTAVLVSESAAPDKEAAQQKSLAGCGSVGPASRPGRWCWAGVAEGVTE